MRCARRDGAAGRLGPICADPDGAKRAQKKRLIPDICRAVFSRVDGAWPCQASAIAAGDHDRIGAFVCEMLNDRHDRGGFACPSGVKVADTDNGDRWLVVGRTGDPFRGCGGVKRAKR